MTQNQMQTRRERVLTSLSHKEPDKIPVDLSGHKSSGISAIAYARLLKYLGMSHLPIRIYDPIQQLAIVDEQILNLFNVDTIELGRAFATEDKYWKEWTLPDGSPCFLPVWVQVERLENEWVMKSKSGNTIGKMPDGCLYFEQAYYPFETADNLNEIEAMFDEIMWTAIKSPPGPIIETTNGSEILAKGAANLRNQTDRAIIAIFGGNLLETGQFFYRNDNFLMLLAENPERAEEFLDKIVQIHLHNLESFLKPIAPYVDIILFGDDLGMQRGPQISPSMYRRFFKPRHKLMWKRVKEIADVKIMLHCCGGVQELLDDLIDAGLDAINPVQISCRGMNPTELKQKFGTRLTFWGGGCDTQTLLSYGKPSEVYDHVKKLMEIWRPGGGYVFQQVHNILANVPPENIIAMYKAVNEA
ncbi:MAG TPA: uroporphyrinogen decarboxylase family protein [Verrucomicrobiota bacterium]|nr:uroporphyrinogen decarboxylase family protein [Verrucomicrobiota bacterium]